MLIKQTRPLLLFRGPSVLWGIQGGWQGWGLKTLRTQDGRGVDKVTLRGSRKAVRLKKAGYWSLQALQCKVIFVTTNHQLLNEGNELPVLRVKQADK